MLGQHRSYDSRTPHAILRTVAVDELHSNQPASAADETALLASLRGGDEAAFVALVERYDGQLLRVALMYVKDRAAAEEVVQETWIGLLQGLRRFEGRSSLKTYLFRILVNIARTRGRKDQRSVPFSLIYHPADDRGEAAVDADRFRSPTEPNAGQWHSPPKSWAQTPEHSALAGETRAFIEAAIAKLAPQQREVITLRDVEGWSAAEVCNGLDISETNQRVLLHRARSKVRAALEIYFDEAGDEARA